MGVLEEGVKVAFGLRRRSRVVILTPVVSDCGRQCRMYQVQRHRRMLLSRVSMRFRLD